MIPEWLRFLSVNAVGLIVDLGCAIILILLGANIFLAACVSFTLAAAFNYRLHKVWTFGNIRRTGAHKFAAFYLAALITIVVRLAALGALIALDLPYAFDRDLELLFLATSISIIANYLACKRLIFKT